ncbi:unnamed protein product [Amoebophrya sp. A25]|nr:unnamed protein product [Amoebophrya sp. A25]|eukprot:GSA25T00005388001.1
MSTDRHELSMNSFLQRQGPLTRATSFWSWCLSRTVGRKPISDSTCCGATCFSSTTTIPGASMDDAISTTSSTLKHVSRHFVNRRGPARPSAEYQTGSQNSESFSPGLHRTRTSRIKTIFADEDDPDDDDESPNPEDEAMDDGQPAPAMNAIGEGSDMWGGNNMQEVTPNESPTIEGVGEVGAVSLVVADWVAKKASAWLGSKCPQTKGTESLFLLHEGPQTESDEPFF